MDIALVYIIELLDIVLVDIALVDIVLVTGVAHTSLGYSLASKLIFSKLHKVCSSNWQQQSFAQSPFSPV